VGDHFAACWIDDVHDLAAVGFNERRINVMRRDFLNCIFVRDSVHRSSPWIKKPVHDKIK
jgi:hypothetical protein